MKRNLMLRYDRTHGGRRCFEICDGDLCLYCVPMYPIIEIVTHWTADGKMQLKADIETADGTTCIYYDVLHHDPWHIMPNTVSNIVKAAMQHANFDETRRKALADIDRFMRAFISYKAATNNATICLANARLVEFMTTEEDHMDDDNRIYHLIEQADRCRRDIVLCLLGKPGIGKTEAIERFARDNGRNVVHIIASQILPNEVSGITMPNQETHSMDVFDHYRLSHMKDGDILFFDELLKGQQHVLNACLTLIQERRLMSGTELPDVLIVAAANPLATPMQLPPEIRQRFMFVDVKWNPKQWIGYMQAEGFGDQMNLQVLADIVEKELNGNFTQWNTLTPRTATKLCRWVRDTGGDRGVLDYIGDNFGVSARNEIKNCALHIRAKTKQQMIADKITKVIDSHRYDGTGIDITIREEAFDKATEMADNKSKDAAASLIATLKKLPEWDEIQDVLRNSSFE